MISFEDFKKVEIRIGKVVDAQKIPEGEKLIKLIFDIGEKQIQVMAGIAQWFEDPSVLVGKEMPVVVNLEPKKLRGYESQGMILAADGDGKPVLLHPAQEVPPGSIVK